MGIDPVIHAQATALANSLHVKRPLVPTAEIFSVALPLLLAGESGAAIEAAVLNASKVTRAAVDYQMAQQRNAPKSVRQAYYEPFDPSTLPPATTREEAAARLRELRRTLGGAGGTSSRSLRAVPPTGSARSASDPSPPPTQPT